MTLGCARCGDCCDPVTISMAIFEDTLRPWFDYWNDGGTECPPELDPTVRFMHEHMTLLTYSAGDDQVEFTCSRFDPASRLCTAHDDAPPMCQDFPWYSTGPEDPYRVSKLPPRCSYALDAAPALRRPDARPLLPLTIRGHEAST